MSKKGFTLMEILIVVAIVALIGTLVIVFLNPLAQLEKAYDTKRKKDLNLLRKAIEEWYNDKGCYPKPSEICYIPPPAENVCEDTLGISKIISQMCYICGNEEDSPSFSPYLGKLPCDPLHPKYKYVYEVEAHPEEEDVCGFSGDTTHVCASWYKVYSSLFDREDKDSYALGCIGQGCGFNKRQVDLIISDFPNGYGFSYGISSPNTKLNYAKQWFCQDSDYTCGNCGGSYGDCLNQPTCNEYGNIIYPGMQSCQGHL